MNSDHQVESSSPPAAALGLSNGRDCNENDRPRLVFGTATLAAHDLSGVETLALHRALLRSVRFIDGYQPKALAAAAENSAPTE